MYWFDLYTSAMITSIRLVKSLYIIQLFPSLSCVWLFVTPWTAACQASLQHHQLPEFTQTHDHWVGDASNSLILCRPLLLLPSILFSIRVFSKESVLHIRWPKYWSFNFSISLSNDYSELVSFRMDWLDLVDVQETEESSPTPSSTASILWHSAFFIVQLSHLYMTTGKIIVLTRWTFIGKAMSLHFNMMSRLVISFLPRSQSLLISW